MLANTEPNYPRKTQRKSFTISPNNARFRSKRSSFERTRLLSSVYQTLTNRPPRTKNIRERNFFQRNRSRNKSKTVFNRFCVSIQKYQAMYISWFNVVATANILIARTQESRNNRREGTRFMGEKITGEFEIEYDSTIRRDNSQGNRRVRPVPITSTGIDVRKHRRWYGIISFSSISLSRPVNIGGSYFREAIFAIRNLRASVGSRGIERPRSKIFGSSRRDGRKIYD